MKAWILAAILSSLLDAGYTCHALNRGHKELNPIMGQSCSQVVAVKAAAIAATPLLPKGKWQKIWLGGITTGSAVGFTVSIALD